MEPAPQTPLGARTPHAHPAFAPVIAVLATATAIGIYLAAAYLLGWWPLARSPEPTSTPSPSASPSPTAVQYRNETFGFLVDLPESWRGFTVGSEVLTAQRLEGTRQTETFREFRIIHPKSTSAVPRQDIPVMVFTHDQWERIQQEKLSVGAAPIPPSELARNSHYIFALPARYNYAFYDGWEEVEAIMKTNPVSAFEPETACLPEGAFAGIPSDNPCCQGLVLGDTPGGSAADGSYCVRPTAWAPFSSQYFTLSFRVPPGYGVSENQNWIYIAQGEPQMGNDLGNVFMYVQRYEGGFTKDQAMANFLQNNRDVVRSTVTVDGLRFTRMDGRDASNVRQFAVFFDRSAVFAHESGLGQTPDYLSISEQILATFRFAKTARPPGPFTLAEHTRELDRYTGMAQLAGTYDQGNDGLLGDLICFVPTWPSRDLLPDSSTRFCFSNHAEAATLLKLGSKTNCSYSGTASIQVRDFTIPLVGGEVVDTSTLVSVQNLQPHPDRCW